jgi:hypothetical protein
MSGDTLEPTLNIDDTEWHKIEKAYGATLSAKVRAHILRATERFLFFESFERSVEPMAKVKVILEAHDKAGYSIFQRAICQSLRGFGRRRLRPLSNRR